MAFMQQGHRKASPSVIALVITIQAKSTITFY